MNLQIATFVALGTALGAALVAAPGRRAAIRLHGWRVAGWQVALATGLAMALVAGVLTPLGILFAGLLIAAGAWHAAQPDRAPAAWAFGGLALAMALHKLPGFHNLLLLDGIRLSPLASPFTLYANVDKGLAGLCLLVFASRPDPGASSGLRLWRQAAGWALACSGTMLLVAWLTGLVRPEPRWVATPDWWRLSLMFLAVNLLLTCVAEEAFFRGLIQGRLARLLTARGWPAWPAVGVAAVLFGAAHLGGGVLYAMVATLAGVGYGMACLHTGRVGVAIAVHFAVNGMHFLFFTYPRLA